MAGSNRRGFLVRLAGIIFGPDAAEVLGGLTAKPPPVKLTETDKFFAAESERIGSQIAKRIAKESPYLNLISGRKPPQKEER